MPKKGVDLAVISRKDKNKPRSPPYSWPEHDRSRVSKKTV